MKSSAPSTSVILAAGKGTRMGATSKHKVCFEIDGVPAINRALRIYNDCGVKRHCLVVGAKAEQVMETVGSEFDNVFYAYQKEQIGTANAVRVGIAPMDSVSGDTDVFVVAGDRIIDQTLLEEFFNHYYSNRYDFALLTVPNHKGSSQGRIVLDDKGRVIAIAEVADIRQRKALSALRRRAEDGTAASIGDVAGFLKDAYSTGGVKPPNSEKLPIIFGDVWRRLVAEREAISNDLVLEMIPPESTRFEYELPGGGKIIKSPEELENSQFVNNSVYIAKLAALRLALRMLNRNNAQKEEYLSDVVSILASRTTKTGEPEFKVGFHNVSDRTLVLGFNDPAELLDVENTIKARGEDVGVRGIFAPEWFRPIAEWRRLFESDVSSGIPSVAADLKALYGEPEKAIASHLENYADLAEKAERHLGPDREAFIVRSPGRVNVMGRHVDHQGGNCNLMTIGYESLILVAPRDDDRIRLRSCDPARFADREFSISDLLADLPWDDWLSLVNSEKLNKMINTYGVDWSNYVQAAVLRLQKKFPHRKLKGMDMVVWGNIPLAAGLSSSSSLVVGTAQAVVAANGLNTFPAQLVTLCGEGEWFVGTRGGSADHAAVMLGQKGKVVKVGFFDFSIEDVVDFPKDYVMVVCDSGIKAEKSSNAKDQFNHRVTCYRIGLKLIHKFCPQYSHLIKHLRDVNTRDLRVPLAWIYKILLHLPERTTRSELKELLPNEELDVFFNMHREPEDGLYPIRGVVMFGLAECERSRLYAEYLRRKDMVAIGRLMNASHDGDRVSKLDERTGKRLPFQAPTSNNHLLRLIDDLESGDLERVAAAQLHWQPGAYHCSLPEIDELVDAALEVDGVVGAQLAGAGLGGCMMALARREAAAELADALRAAPLDGGRELDILVCEPVAGAGILLKH